MDILGGCITIMAQFKGFLEEFGCFTKPLRLAQLFTFIF
jgi:hypothetical protein